jgi:hypothetical protein
LWRKEDWGLRLSTEPFTFRFLLITIYAPSPRPSGLYHSVPQPTTLPRAPVTYKAVT